MIGAIDEATQKLKAGQATTAPDPAKEERQHASSADAA
jgi:hypothetical protein